MAGTASAELLYGANGAGNRPSDLLILDPSTGAVIKTVGPTGFGVTGLAIDPTTGTLYGVTGLNAAPDRAPSPGALITINRATGAGTVVGDLLPGTNGATDITFTSDGRLYGWFETDDILGTIDKATGQATTFGGGEGSYGGGLAFNSAGVLFVAPQGLQGTLDTVDPSTGEVTTGPTLTGPAPEPGISSLAFNAAGQLFGSTNPSDNETVGSTLIRIDASSGTLTTIGSTIDRLDALAFVPDRTVTLKKKLKSHGTKVRLFGQITDTGDPACAAGQQVQVQRKQLGSASKAAKKKKRKFRKFKTVTTKQDGSFSTKAKVTQTFKYRAFLPESNVCDDSTSKPKKVKA